MSAIAKTKKLRKVIAVYYRDLWRVSTDLSFGTGQSKSRFVFDIVYSTLRWGASPNNYASFRFYELSGTQRGTYVTHGLNERLIAKYNDDNFRQKFEDKTQFAEEFKAFFGRDWLSLKNADINMVEEFVTNKRVIIYKPSTLARGLGVEKLDMEAFKDTKAFFEYLEQKQYPDGALLEEWIEQHPEIARIYDRAVNPVRIITILRNGHCNVLVAGLTIGNGGEIANASCGDMVAPINLDSGRIEYPAVDYDGHIYDKHPLTGQNLVGLQIPFWQELVELVNEASKIVPEVGYVGWDVAITPTGPILIEGNTAPGYRSRQLSAYFTGVGTRKIYKEFL